MPVYNCAPYLDEAIWSVRRQTFTDFECVIVDDGSSDGSTEIIQKHKEQDTRILFITQTNSGLVAALNAGIALCRGAYVARMDQDDVALPDRFERQVRFMQTHPDIDCVGGWALVIDGHGAEKNLIRFPLDSASINAALSEGTYALLHPTIMVRATALIGVGGYDPVFKMAEDLDLFLRLSERGKLGNLSEVVLKYRRHGKSMTALAGSNVALWDARALRAAKARGRRVPLSGIARTADRMSWAAVSDHRYCAAFSHAARAMAIAPFSHIGLRAIARVLWRMVRPVSRVPC
jgi:glycosyltransferase involved in cell wall biosynthesis